MGGRGQAYAGIQGAGSEGGKQVYEVKKYKGMSLHEFENAIRDKKNEYIGVVDKDNNIVFAGTSYSEGSVGVPDLSGFDNVAGITHNHPANGKRMIGGSFSGADIRALTGRNLNYVRAVANGPNENTYIIRKKEGASSKNDMLFKYATRAGDQTNVNKIYNRAVTKVNERLSKKGMKLTPSQETQVGYGALKRRWKTKTVSNAGYEYIEVKKARW